jgi:phosphoribosylamine--glycine ligase
VHALTDGKTWRLLPSAQDHKRVFDNDQGPNTGGMGAYAPAPLFDEALRLRVEKEIIQPVVDALRAEGIDYRGVLYAGLMITKDGPKVLEFNSRFGDPETQVLLPLLETPLLDILLAVVGGSLDQQEFKIKKASAMAVVLAAPGYPEKPELGGEIEGLRHADPKGKQMVFHAGTVEKGGKVLTSGGRVLAVTGVAPTLAEARDAAYEAVEKIHFPGAHYRKDIGAKALK